MSQIMTKYDMDEKLSPPSTGWHPGEDYMVCHMDDKLWHRPQMMANKYDIDFKREQGTWWRMRVHTRLHPSDDNADWSKRSNWPVSSFCSSATSVEPSYSSSTLSDPKTEIFVVGSVEHSSKVILFPRILSEYWHLILLFRQIHFAI